MDSRGESVERDTRFGGYGDRVGSGVELAPTRWRGGELVTDPTLITKSLKPRRFYYSPIGDGVVAADGIELKRGPVDLTPKVEVIHQQIRERGDRGAAGRKVTEHTWSSGGGGGSTTNVQSQSSTHGEPQPPKAADVAVKAAPPPQFQPPPPSSNAYASPFGGLSDPLAFGSTGLGSPAAAPPSAPASHSYAKPAINLDSASAPASNYNSLSSRPSADPYAALGSPRTAAHTYDTLPKSESSYGGAGGDYPASGRTSTTSALFSEPGYRYEIEKRYKVTNPRELIHQYATTTPISTVPGYQQLAESGTTRTVKQSYMTSTEETYAPYPPYTAGAHSVNPNRFVRQLRDDNLTITQRAANQQTQPANPKDARFNERIEQIRRQTRTLSPNSDVDELTSRLVSNLHTRKY